MVRYDNRGRQVRQGRGGRKYRRGRVIEEDWVSLPGYLSKTFIKKTDPSSSHRHETTSTAEGAPQVGVRSREWFQWFHDFPKSGSQRVFLSDSVAQSETVLSDGSYQQSSDSLPPTSNSRTKGFNSLYLWNPLRCFQNAKNVPASALRKHRLGRAETQRHNCETPRPKARFNCPPSLQVRRRFLDTSRSSKPPTSSLKKSAASKTV